MLLAHSQEKSCRGAWVVNWAAFRAALRRIQTATRLVSFANQAATSAGCYSFWVGGTLQLLGMEIERQSCARFLQTCESSGLEGPMRW